MKKNNQATSYSAKRRKAKEKVDTCGGGLQKRFRSRRSPSALGEEERAVGRRSGGRTEVVRIGLGEGLR